MVEPLRIVQLYPHHLIRRQTARFLTYFYFSKKNPILVVYSLPQWYMCPQMCPHATCITALNSVPDFSYFLLENMEKLVTSTRCNSKNIHQNHDKLSETIWMLIFQSVQKTHCRSKTQLHCFLWLHTTWHSSVACFTLIYGLTFNGSAAKQIVPPACTCSFSDSVILDMLNICHCDLKGIWNVWRNPSYLKELLKVINKDWSLQLSRISFQSWDIWTCFICK